MIPMMLKIMRVLTAHHEDEEDLRYKSSSHVSYKPNDHDFHESGSW